MSSSLSGYTGPGGGSNTTGSNLMGDKIPKGYRAGQIQQFTPEQMDLFKQNFSHIGPQSNLSRLAAGDEDIFNQIEAPALRQFQDLQGQNASRFSGYGMGARRGSGFQNAQSQATSDFAQNLASNRQNLMRQALNDLMGYSSNILQQRPNERFLTKKQQDQGVNWGGLAGAAAGGIGGFFLGGPPGALAGASGGYNIGSGLSGYGGGDMSGQDFSSLSGLFEGGGNSASYHGQAAADPGIASLAARIY
jgi:hypothetical protein